MFNVSCLHQKVVHFNVKLQCAVIVKLKSPLLFLFWMPEMYHTPSRVKLYSIIQLIALNRFVIQHL